MINPRLSDISFSSPQSQINAFRSLPYPYQNQFVKVKQIPCDKEIYHAYFKNNYIGDLDWTKFAPCQITEFKKDYAKCDIQLARKNNCVTDQFYVDEKETSKVFVRKVILDIGLCEWKQVMAGADVKSYLMLNQLYKELESNVNCEQITRIEDQLFQWECTIGLYTSGINDMADNCPPHMHSYKYMLEKCHREITRALNGT